MSQSTSHYPSNMVTYSCQLNRITCVYRWCWQKWQHELCRAIFSDSQIQPNAVKVIEQRFAVIMKNDCKSNPRVSRGKAKGYSSMASQSPDLNPAEHSSYWRKTAQINRSWIQLWWGQDCALAAMDSCLLSWSCTLVQLKIKIVVISPHLKY